MNWILVLGKVYTKIAFGTNKHIEYDLVFLSLQIMISYIAECILFSVVK